MADNEPEGSDDRALFDHLVDQFDEGRDAVAFLKTAQWLLAVDAAGHAPRQAGAAAYCVREALDRLLPPELGQPRWRELSAEVVHAKRRFEAIRGLPGTDEARALNIVLAALDRLEEFKENEPGQHQRRLAGLLEVRTGAPPLSRPLREYQRLLGELNSNAVHRTASVEQVRDLLERALAVLRTLFAPFQLRRRELDALAQLLDPGEGDVRRLLDQCSTPHHLRYFMEHAAAPQWLFLLTPHGVLDPPAGGAPWPVGVAVERLGRTHPQEVARWLEGAYKRWGASETGAAFVALAARDCLPAASATLLRALRAYPRSSWIRGQAMHALEVMDPSDPLIDDAALVLLDPDDELALGGLAQPTIQALVDGMNLDNADARISLLARKLAAAAESRYLSFMVMPSGSVEDVPEDEGRAIGVLLKGVVAAVRRGREVGLPTDRVLALLEPLQGGLLARLRAWALSEATDVPPEALVTEITHAIGERDPTGDDVRLIQRVVEEPSSDSYLDSWRGVIGLPPTTQEVGRALALQEIPRAWQRAILWSPLLPEAVREAWETTVTLMSPVAAAPGREAYLEPPSGVQFDRARSPMTRSDLEGVDVDEVARRISSWRPSGDQRMVIARELARTLEDLVASDPVSWASRPLRTLALLRHATYVNHFFQGLAKTSGDLSGLGPGLVEAVVFARTHPWRPERLGSDDFDYDPTWAPADQAGIDLIGRLAERDVDLGDRYEDAWRVVVGAARDRSGESGISPREDPLETAINRPCTRALQAMFHLVATEFRRDGTVREEGLELLDEALELDGWSGAEHRAIIAPRLAFLLHVAPEWVESREARLFGGDAPDALGEMTVELALKWGLPNRWLLERHSRAVFKAVRAGSTNALDHALVAMLWAVSGYSTEAMVRKMAPTGASVVSDAGERLGRLLRDADQEHINRGVLFWEHTLGNQTLPGEALRGFGWWAEVEELDQDRWEQLTFATSQRAQGSLAWCVKVAERCSREPITATGLGILASLLRGQHDPWERPQVAEVAFAALRASGSDSRLSEARERLRAVLIDLGYFEAADM